VFKGPSAVRDYFDPDRAPPLPLVELPESLNPFRNDGVRIYAKMMSTHPTNNVKSMPGEPSPRNNQFCAAPHADQALTFCPRAAQQ